MRWSYNAAERKHTMHQTMQNYEYGEALMLQAPARTFLYRHPLGLNLMTLKRRISYDFLDVLDVVEKIKNRGPVLFLYVLFVDI